MSPVSPPVLPTRDCPLCPRLAGFRADNRAAFPDFHNAPVDPWGPLDAPVLIVGLAPGLRGANRTGRPFTGDYAGDLLYATLLEFGLAEGSYGREPDDGMRLTGVRITNAVKCVPPENKPVGAEIAACRPFLVGELAAMPRLRAILALGQIAHTATLVALGLKASSAKFGHGAVHRLGDGKPVLHDSYHCSRYNVNTNRLTAAMFADVVSGLPGAVRRA